jgi:hypothetical protein
MFSIALREAHDPYQCVIPRESSPEFLWRVLEELSEEGKCPHPRATGDESDFSNCLS